MHSVVPFQCFWQHVAFSSAFLLLQGVLHLSYQDLCTGMEKRRDLELANWSNLVHHRSHVGNVSSAGVVDCAQSIPGMYRKLWIRNALWNGEGSWPFLSFISFVVTTSLKRRQCCCRRRTTKDLALCWEGPRVRRGVCKGKKGHKVTLEDLASSLAIWAVWQKNPRSLATTLLLRWAKGRHRDSRCQVVSKCWCGQCQEYSNSCQEL